MARRRYSPEHKQEAVTLGQQFDIPISEVARNLGINDNMLRRWDYQTDSWLDFVRDGQLVTNPFDYETLPPGKYRLPPK